jgi:hypothetical protein
VRRRALAANISVHNSPVQTYRSSIWLDVVGCVIAPLTLLACGIGVAVDPGGQGDPGTAPGYIVSGVVIGAVGIFFAVTQVTTRLVVNEHGLAWRYFLRTKTVSWDDVEDVEVLPSGSGAYCAGIRTRPGLIAIKSVNGSELHAQTIVEALKAAKPPRASGRAIAATTAAGDPDT